MHDPIRTDRDPLRVGVGQVRQDRLRYAPLRRLPLGPRGCCPSAQIASSVPSGQKARLGRYRAADDVPGPALTANPPASPCHSASKRLPLSSNRMNGRPSGASASIGAVPAATSVTDQPPRACVACMVLAIPDCSNGELSCSARWATPWAIASDGELQLQSAISVASLHPPARVDARTPSTAGSRLPQWFRSPDRKESRIFDRGGMRVA